MAGFAVTKVLKLMQFLKPLTWLPARSLRLRLIALWLAVAAACGVAAFLMREMFQISVSAQVDRADAILGKGCANIAERYRFYAAGWHGVQDLKNETLKRDLAAVVNLASAMSAADRANALTAKR